MSDRKKAGKGKPGAAWSVTVQATCVAVDGLAVLLRGASGSGKSDLALRLIDAGAALIADDLTRLTSEQGRLIAHAPDRLAGHIEVRGIGILRADCLPKAPVALVVDLIPSNRIERLPEPAAADFAGLSVPAVAIDPFTASAAAKVRLAVRQAAPRKAR